VLCGYLDPTRTLDGYKVHASAPFEAPSRDEEVVWVDLDLDFEVAGDVVSLEDEAQFHDHAGTMGYPDEVVRGAWSGISTIAARYTNGDWPFDGSMQRWVDSAPA
jgi:protein associated with RNAse G/E